MGENRNENVHSGHRQRMRDRFEKNMDLSLFADHEVLEMMLYAYIPMKDTNEIAHDLLKKFLSVENVLNADPKELETVKGISHRTALSMAFMRQLYRTSALRGGQKLMLAERERLYRYLKELYFGESEEKMNVLFIDVNMCVVSVEQLERGQNDTLKVDMKHLAASVLSSKCTTIVLVHNHPDGDPTPSRDDITTTNRIRYFVKEFGIELIDHFIVGRDNVISMADNGLLYQNDSLE